MFDAERSQRQTEILQKQAALMREYEHLQSQLQPPMCSRQYMTPEETELLIQQQTTLTLRHTQSHLFQNQPGMLQPQNTYLLQQPSMASTQPTQVIEILEDLQSKKRQRCDDEANTVRERPKKKANITRTFDDNIADATATPDNFLAQFEVDLYSANQGKTATEGRIKKTFQEREIPFSIGKEQCVTVSVHGQLHRIYVTGIGSIHLLGPFGNIVASFVSCGALFDYMEGKSHA